MTCLDVDECELGLCNQPESWCINLRGSFACCTVNSTSSDCVGLEITGGRDGGFRIMNAGTIQGHHKLSSVSTSSSSLKFGPGSSARTENQASKSSSKYSKGISDLGGHESIASSHSHSGRIYGSSERGSSNSGSWSHRGEGSSSSKHKGGYRVETVGEWKNYTGHAVIIGRGRLENKRWNLTDLGNGRYTIGRIEQCSLNQVQLKPCV